MQLNKNFFSFCIGIKNIYYAGTEEQWENIIIESGNDYLSKANIIYVK